MFIFTDYRLTPINTNKINLILLHQIGDLLELNCTSEPSHPASHLSWEMNKVPVGEDNYIFRDTVHNGQYCIIYITMAHHGQKVKLRFSLVTAYWMGDSSLYL